MTTMISNDAQNDLDWATAALAAHKAVAGILGDAEFQVWHLVCSLLTYCEVNGIDIDKTLAEVREHQAETAR